MKNAFANKVSYFILTFLFLIITASFLFSGFDKFKLGGSSKNVATVDGTPITIREYQTALSRQVEFFNQMMGGKGLTQKQLEDMGIKQTVLNGLVQQKLILNAAESLGIIVSLDEVKNEIKNLPYFKTANQFDVNLYKNVLQSNGFVPTQFEELVGSDLKQKKMDEFFSTSIVSENYVKDVLRFKNNSITVFGVKISRQSLSPLISVSEQEIKEYLSKEENKKALNDTYQDNINTYVKPEEVKAKHILLTGDDAKVLEKIKDLRSKVNPKNFAQIANKETQDPSGKNNGGELGWFSAGKMVPEFDAVAFKLGKGQISEPVKTQFGYHIIFVEDKKAAETKTLEMVKSEIAQMNIQKTKAQDLDKLLKSEQERLLSALNSNNFAEVENLAKKVQGQIFKNIAVNHFDQTLESANLAPQEADQLFKATVGTTINLGNSGAIYLVKVVSKNTTTDLAKKIEDQLKSEVGAQTQASVRRNREEFLRAQNNKAKVVTNPALM